MLWPVAVSSVTGLTVMLSFVGAPLTVGVLTAAPAALFVVGIVIVNVPTFIDVVIAA